MNKSKTIEIEGIGPVLFERSRKARRLNITIRPVKVVRVAVPYGLSFSKAEEFVRPKSGWIKKHLLRAEAAQQRHRELLKDLPAIGEREAKEILRKRTDELSRQYGFRYNRIFVRNQKTKWGSCSAGNNINLNIKLARLPDELLDYVILHELVHTEIKNHGSAFWSALDALVGDAKKIDAKLNQYHLGLF